ncbi:hypothetical protein [Nocardia thailandica]
MRTVHRGAAALSLALLLAACGGGETVPAPAGTSTNSTTAVHSVNLPECGGPPRPASPDGAFPSCRLTSNDSAALSFVVRFEAAGRTATETIEVIDRSGARRATLMERDVVVQFPPQLIDLDGDGRDELVVPRDSAANGNTRNVVYRDSDSGFVRAGELSGEPPQRTPSGYIAVAAKGGAASWDIGFWTIDGRLLREHTRVQIESHLDDRGTGTSVCRLTDAQGRPDQALTESEAGQRFCAEPIVVSHKPYN